MVRAISAARLLSCMAVALAQHVEPMLRPHIPRIWDEKTIKEPESPVIVRRCLPTAVSVEYGSNDFIPLFATRYLVALQRQLESHSEVTGIRNAIPPGVPGGSRSSRFFQLAVPDLHGVRYRRYHDKALLDNTVEGVTTC